MFVTPEYGEDLEPYDAEDGQAEDEERLAVARQRMAAQRALIESYGLQIGTLCDDVPGTSDKQEDAGDFFEIESDRYRPAFETELCFPRDRQRCR